ncbi:MAG: DegT/DnrJ/EryC1/StrS family aminotransferase [Bacteroidota bacterium]|jgi:dTDP-4-amino-4,6-dideoxygalactose transaminase
MGTDIQSIGMLDLVGQYQRLQPEIDAAIASVLQAGDFIQGKSVRQLETELADYLSVNHVISCGNGTDALQLAFMVLNLPKGSEVIIPSFAYAALAEVVLLLDLVPVYVEVDDHDYTINVEDIEQHISSKTKVIAPVHLFGRLADMDGIMAIANKHNLYVIEDAAQAIGAYYQGEVYQGFAGTLGTLGTTSFFPSKNLGCFGDGGAVFCADDALASEVRQLANHGQSTKYIHDLVGVNSRLDTLQAAVLRVKLSYLNEFSSKRIKIALNYCSRLRGLEISGLIRLPLSIDECAGLSDLPWFADSEKRTANGETVEGFTPLLSGHVFHQFTLQVIAYEKRDALRQFLLDRGISTMVYYPLPLHRQKAYYQEVALPDTERLCKSVMSIPICPELSEDGQKKIISSIEDFFNSL